jgi:poly-beta-1,6-N-acetyl-D-glucosamine biosynthesis protein PgaD
VQHPLIINARRQLRWHQRLFCDASTFALWSMWLWMCRPVLLSAMGLVGMMMGYHHPAKHPLFPGAMVSAEDAVFLLLCTGGLLMLWNRVASQPAVRPRVNAVPDYARYFDLDPRAIADARQSGVCTVHHDEQGRIVRIESRDVLPAASNG